MDLEPWLGETVEAQARFPIVPDAVIQFANYAVGAIVLALLVAGLVELARPDTLRRRFWCPAARNHVEVEFVTRSFRRLASVRRCTAFEDAQAITCTRRCLDARFRRHRELARVPPRPGRRAAA
jgi:hypothetical protein